ncbi:TPA: amino acid-binding protein [Providencia rettgeri]
MYNIHLILDNQPGILALLGSTLGQHGIGLEGGSVFVIDGKSHVHFLIENTKNIHQAISYVGLQLESISQPVVCKLKQERPGELDEIALHLAQHHINILVQYSDHNNRLILLTDNNELAVKVTKRWSIPHEINPSCSSD